MRLESGVLADESRSQAGARRNESIRRAFRVLECLARLPGASVAAVARETGLPRATVTRVLGTLADLGAVRRDRGGWDARAEQEAADPRLWVPGTSAASAASRPCRTCGR